MLRLNKVSFLLIVLLSVFFLFIKEGKTESAKFIFVEEKKPRDIFLFPGRISLLSLPCPITKALIGAPKDIKAEVDQLTPKELNILLKKWSSQPSNLIVKCKDKVFLFNLISSKKSHYDYVKVLGHILSKPLKLKSTIPNSPSPRDVGGLREKDFKIRKILDFSWEDRK